MKGKALRKRLGLYIVSFMILILGDKLNGLEMLQLFLDNMRQDSTKIGSEENHQVKMFVL